MRIASGAADALWDCIQALMYTLETLLRRNVRNFVFYMNYFAGIYWMRFKIVFADIFYCSNSCVNRTASSLSRKRSINYQSSNDDEKVKAALYFPFFWFLMKVSIFFRPCKMMHQNRKRNFKMVIWNETLDNFWILIKN